MKKIVSLIPARGGSKGIPHKNIVRLKGKPLIFYVLLSSLLCPKIHETWVSTEDSAIRKVCEKLFRGYYRFDNRVMILDRPKELAQDDTSTEDVMLHFADNVNFDVVVLIQATSPMVTKEQIGRGLDIFESGEYDSVFSVVRAEDTLVWLEDSFGFHPLNHDLGNRKRRQTRDSKTLIESGGFYITSREQLMKSRCRMSGRIGVVEVPFWSSFQVDELEDLKNVGKLMT